MGTWGTRLTDDDYASDIISEYFDLYNEGKDPREIRSTLERKEADNLNDSDDGHIFWLALARAQWDIGALDDDVLERVKKIVEKGTDIKSWIERGATEKEIKNRKESIVSFLKKIQSPNPKPRKKKKVRLKDSPYEIGDVLVFQFLDGDYGAALIVAAEKQTKFGLTGIVTLHIKQPKKPVIEDIKRTDVLITTEKVLEWSQPKQKDKIDASYIFHNGYKNVRAEFECIGKIKINKIPVLRQEYTLRWENYLRSVQFSINRLGRQKLTLSDFLNDNYNLNK